MLRLGAVLTLPLLFTGCGMFSDEPAEGTLKIEPEGISGYRLFNVSAIEIFEMKSEQKDPFEIVGEGVSLCGTLWPYSGLSEGDMSIKLLGKEADIVVQGGNPYNRKPSTVAIPELGENVRFAQGTVTFENVESAGDGTVITGKLKYTLETDKGQMRGIGMFKARAKITQRQSESE
ncbi:MAG: hypothetical protein HYY16_06905 [Planctomycetes bacterium]|nr:hypothetical protein [Planctomycetota bacterium]